MPSVPHLVQRLFRWLCEMDRSPLGFANFDEAASEVST